MKKIKFWPKSLNRPREFQQMAFAIPIFNGGFGMQYCNWFTK